MKAHITSSRLLAASLGVFLVACHATRSSNPSNAAELSRLALVIQTSPDGQVVHRWRPAEELELPQGRSPASAHVDGRIVFAVGRQRDCDEENRECIRECMSRPLPRGFGHVTSKGRGKGGKAEYCNNQCMQPYLDCSKLQELQPRMFSATDDAVAWLKRNHESILVGSAIIIAGVTFAVVIAEAGLIILVPVLLLATSTVDAGSELCGVEAP